MNEWGSLGDTWGVESPVPSDSSQGEGLELRRERRRIGDSSLQQYNRITGSGSGAEPKIGGRALGFHHQLVSNLQCDPGQGIALLWPQCLH